MKAILLSIYDIHIHTHTWGELARGIVRREGAEDGEADMDGEAPMLGGIKCAGRARGMLIGFVSSFFDAV